jgi:hypothetical protein
LAEKEVTPKEQRGTQIRMLGREVRGLTFRPSLQVRVGFG